MNQTITTEYDKLFEDFSKEVRKHNSQVELNCVRGLRKLRLAKQFANIDNELLDLSLVAEESIGFFTQILNLEAKRLKFKEEALKSLEIEAKKTKLSAA